METLEFLVGHCGDQGGLSPLLWRQTPFMAFVANLEKSHSGHIQRKKVCIKSGWEEAIMLIVVLVFVINNGQTIVFNIG